MARTRIAIGFIGAGCLVLLACALIGLRTRTSRQAESSDTIWDQRIKVASGGGHRGPWRMNESEFHYVDDPTVAIGQDGTVAVAWADQTRHDLFIQIYEPGGRKRFEQPTNISRSPRVFSWLPRMLIGRSGSNELYVLWQEIVFSGGSHGGEIFFARSTNGGKSFGAPLNLSNSTAGDGKGRLARSNWHNGSLDLALSGQGTLYAVWTEYQGALWFSHSADSGWSFSSPLRVAGDDGAPARGPSLAVSTDGAIHLAWTIGEDRSADIRVTNSVNGGESFDEPRLAFKSEGHCDAPKLAVDRKGTLHLVYAESIAHAAERYSIRYARSRDGGRSFEQPKDISSTHNEQFESVSFPMLRLDGAGNVYVVWELFPESGGRSQGLGFTLSTNGGQTFSAPSVISGSIDPALGYNGSQQGLLMSKLDVSESGAIVVVNSTFKPSESSQVWLLRGRVNRRLH